MEGKRTFLAIALTCAVLLLWMRLFPPAITPAAAVPTPSSGVPTLGHAEDEARPAATNAATPNLTAGPAPEPVAIEAGAAGAAVGPEPQLAVVSGSTPRRVEISTPRYTIEVSNVGGVVTNVNLLRFRARVALPGETSPTVKLIGDTSEYGVQPLSFLTGDDGVDAGLEAIVYQMEGESTTLADGEHATVTLRWADGAGAELAKTLVFSGSSYVIEVQTEAVLASGRRVMVGLGPGLEPPVDRPTAAIGRYDGHIASLIGDKVKRRDEHKVGIRKIRALAGGAWPPARGRMSVLEELAEVERQSSVDWFGVESNYFAMVAFAPGGFSEVISFPALREPDDPPRLVAAVPAGGQFSLYLGPKDLKELAAARPDLVHLVDYGFFDMLARFLFASLEYLYRYVHNWGVAIVILTVIIKTAFIPLTVKQMRIAEKMAALAPQMKAIEAKYKKLLRDPETRADANQKMQAERMSLFQKEGVNPMGGCLPMLIYLPFLYGFYSVLTVAIELRHAPFALWIQDLSARDPFYVSPILMVISMVVQQALTPATGDVMQRRLMFLMPVVFGWVLKEQASGLVLFWLTQNLLSILQQAYMTRKSTKQKAEAKRTARRGDAGQET